MKTQTNKKITHESGVWSDHAQKGFFLRENKETECQSRNEKNKNSEGLTNQYKLINHLNYCN